MIYSYPKKAHSPMVTVWLWLANFGFRHKLEIGWVFYRRALKKVNNNLRFIMKARRRIKNVQTNIKPSLFKDEYGKIAFKT